MRHNNRRLSALHSKGECRKTQRFGQGKGGFKWDDLFDFGYDEVDDDYDHDWPADSEDDRFDFGHDPEESIQNAWVMFGNVAQSHLVPTQQKSISISCAICCERDISLLMNFGCTHVACEVCWRWWAAQFPRRNAAPCFMPGCGKKLGKPVRPEQLGSPQLPGIIAVRAWTVSRFQSWHEPRDWWESRLARGMLPAIGPRFVGAILHLEIRASITEKPSLSDNVCSLCCENGKVLLQNSGCSSSACGTCWGRWVDTQLPRCRATRQLRTVPCFTPGCCQAMSPTLLRRSCADSEDGSALMRDLFFRQRLQRSVLYPPETHADCPIPGCVGLGYLGFDQVMCFICEHQWVSTGTGPTDDAPDGIKECPKCQVRIAKDGGCDHMSCIQCMHEFWWSSLAPYNRD